jgi:phosphate-selective porin
MQRAARTSLAFALVVLGSVAAQSCAAEVGGAGVSWSGNHQARETVRPHEGVRFSVPAARLVADARLDSIFTVRVSAEVAATSGSGPAAVQMRDAYLHATHHRWTARAGQFKTPQSRELLMMDEVIETPDRSVIIGTLTPGRDLGVQLAYAGPGRKWDVAAGVFNGEGQNVSQNRDSTVLFAGRATARPAGGIALGVSGAAFGGDSTRYGADLELHARGGWVRAEVLVQEIDGRAQNDEGWYGLAGWHIAPAWAVVVRWEQLNRPAQSAETSRLRASTIGLLWEPAGRRLRAHLDRVDRRTGQDPIASHQWVGQVQARF